MACCLNINRVVCLDDEFTVAQGFREIETDHEFIITLGRLEDWYLPLPCLTPIIRGTVW